MGIIPSKAGIKVWASQKEKTSFGPVMRSCGLCKNTVRTEYRCIWCNAYLGDKTLEEAGESLVLGHVGQDPETALRVLEVAVLNTSLDYVQRRRDDQRSRGAGN